MPAQSTLSESEVASVLNYLGSGLGKIKLPPPFNAKDVSDVRARHPDKSPQSTHALRPSPSGP